MPENSPEPALRQIAHYHLSRVLEYDPYGNFDGVSSAADFRSLIQSDPAFESLGLATDKYVIARVGGNLITSLHRKIGDMYEALFQHLIARRFGLSPEELDFGVTVQIGDRAQVRSTDGFVPSHKLGEVGQAVLGDRMTGASGVAFEVRSCYQIGDSKRIQADYDMALALQAQGITPVMLILCMTSLRSPVARLSQSWVLYEGSDAFDFIAQLTGFDLRGFLQQESQGLGQIMDQIMGML